MRKLLATATLAALGFMCAGAAFAQDPYLGEIRLFGFNFCPTGWMAAQGQILNLSSYTALYSLYGTQFGGNGTQTFGLPNLQGRAPIGVDSTNPIGVPSGNATVTLTVANLPPFRPQFYASSAAPSTSNPSGALLSTLTSGRDYAAAGSPADKPMSANAIGQIGSGIPINTQSPSLSLTWCVAMSGIYPSRN